MMSPIYKVVLHVHEQDEDFAKMAVDEMMQASSHD
ncbi:unnamed protein product, partial [marine sediment metagenome]